MSRRRRQPELSVEDSWRMVDGEHDSFDTSLVPGLEDDDILHPLSSGHTSSGLPSQLSQFSSQGQASNPAGFSSQDSIRDFTTHGEDEQVILREPFRPSLSSRTATSASRGSASARTPDPEFMMPLVDTDYFDRRSSGASSRTARPFGRGLGDDDGLRRRSKGSRANVRQAYGRRHSSGEKRSIQDHVNQSLPSALFDVLLWALDVIGLAFRYARRPIALLLSAYLLFGGLILIGNSFTSSLMVALSPICRVPGVSLLGLPFCNSPHWTNGTGARNVDFDDLMELQLKFGELLEKNAETASLPEELSRSSIAVRDLRILVRNSELEGKTELMPHLDGYIDSANDIVHDLIRFNTRVGGTVDRILIINRWTSRYIDTLAEGPSPGLVEWTSWVFSPFQPSNQVFTEQGLRDQYLKHTSLVSDRIDSLVAEAEGIRRLLNQADDHLSSIYEITTRSTDTIASSRSLVLHYLGSLLRKIAIHQDKFGKQLVLLGRVETQRAAAASQLSDLIVQLRTMKAGLLELRDRVADPGPLIDAASAGAGTLPLSMHIDTINAGVERLAATRRRFQAEEADARANARHAAGYGGEPLIEAEKYKG